MAEIQFRPAYLNGLAQFTSMRPRLFVTPGHRLSRQRRDFNVVCVGRRYDMALGARTYTVNINRRDYAVSRMARTYRITA